MEAYKKENSRRGIPMAKFFSKKIFSFYATFLALVLFLCTFGVTTSRYMGLVQSDDPVVAVPILDLSNDQMVYTIDKMLPGEEREYEFYVTNKANDKINEVQLDYQFVITSTTEIPLQFKLYDITDNKEQELVVMDNKTASIEMPHGIEETHQYRLKIIWDKAQNDVRYANQKVSLKIELKGAQVLG